MRGIVITKNADLFTVDSNGKIFLVKPSGKTKDGGIFVGDNVEFEQSITKVLSRKNLLIRPPVANVEKMFIVLSEVPKPDFVLVDKIIIYCLLNDIIPVIVINKEDICSQEFISQVRKDYSYYTVITICAKNGQIEKLEREINGLSVLVGQSAVGKTSIINALIKDGGEKVGSLSKKVVKGKQTTRLVKLFKIKGNYLADTAGFSLLNLSIVTKLEKEELSSYYPEFLSGRAKCKYRSCLHEGGDCGVLRELQEGKITQNRYENYLKILQELKQAKRY